MNKYVLDEVQQRAFEAAKPEGTRLFWTYEGRGMYGQTCVGLLVEEPNERYPLAEILQFCMELALSDELDFDYEYLTKARWDLLGKGMVYYWPNLATA